MTVMTAVRLGEALMAPAKMSLGYADGLCKDIPAAKFGHMPHPKMNHPAFNMGHLSLYPNRLMQMLGLDRHVKEKAGWDLLFKAGVECVENDGRYPSKDEIVEFYMDRYKTVIELLPSVGDDVFTRENPAEGRFKEMLPSVGNVAIFMLTSHPMMHLGQISAWRRAMGMGSVM